MGEAKRTAGKVAMSFTWRADGRRRWLVLAGAVGLVCVATLADYLTGPELAVSVLYVLPVALAALVGLPAGVVMSVLAAVGWVLTDVLANAPHSHPLIPYADALVQLPLFLIVAYLVSSLQRSRLMQRELTEFIVHDLKSPLTAIQAALKSSRRHCDLSNQALDTVLKAGLSSLERLTMMVNALLDVARAEDDRLEVEVAVVAVGELARAAAEQLLPWATELGVALTVAVDPATPPALADANLTTRVLVNLLSNALKYSPPQTKVRVTVAPDDRSGVRVAVEDQGPGVPAAWLKRVFGKFEQVQARQAGAAVGTGLGLAFCQMAVQAQGGRIWMESQPNVRTAVMFTLPAA